MKRMIVAVVFIVLAIGLLVDLRPLSAQGACGNCEQVGTLRKCNGHEAVATGATSGNCISVTGDSEINETGQTVFCTVTSFYNCTVSSGGSGCPIGGGSGCQSSGGSNP